MLTFCYLSVNHFATGNSHHGVMRSKIGLGLGWALVTLAAVAVTSAAVGSVRSNVTESAAPAFLLDDQPNSAQRDAASFPAQSGPVTEDPSSDAPVPGVEPTTRDQDVPSIDALKFALKL